MKVVKLVWCVWLCMVLVGVEVMGVCFFVEDVG